MRSVVYGALVVSALSAASAEAHKPTTTTFTYHEDIYPILSEKCGSCHRTGGVAPMSLLTYEETFPWAVSIKNEILTLAMPPWFADERYGEFRHAAGLTAGEMNTIVDWCLGGSPEGEAAEDARPENAEWKSGTPDLELPMAVPFVLEAATSSAVHDVTLETNLDSDRQLRAFDFRPGADNIVRSARIYLGATPRADRLVAAWIPGQEPVSLPPGRGRVVPKNAELLLRLHYKKTWLDEGSPVEDRSTLGLYFHEHNGNERLEPVVVAGSTTTPAEKGSGYQTHVSHKLAGDLELVAIVPQLESRLASVTAEAVRPDGSRERLIRLREPDPDWPRTFWLKTPLSLPVGTEIELTLTAAEAEALSAQNALLLDGVVP